MKHSKYFVAAMLLITMSGCLFVEKIETRVRFPKKSGTTAVAQPPLVTMQYYNISSDAEDAKKLQEDFEELTKEVGADGAAEETEDGVIVKKREVYIEGGKINARTEGVAADNKLEGVVANGERILVVERTDDSELLETNGKILKTEKNYVLVWPESEEEIYWIQRMRPEAKDKPAIERNRPQLVRMVAEHLQQK